MNKQTARDRINELLDPKIYRFNISSKAAAAALDFIATFTVDAPQPDIWEKHNGLEFSWEMRGVEVQITFDEHGKADLWWYKC